MRKLTLTLLALAAGVFAFKADAMPLAGVGQAADGLSAVERTQYFYGGRNYCWYPNGWHGPGFYWCGYAARVGYGWGGPVGWRGWSAGGPVVVGPRVYGPRVYGPRVYGPRVYGPRGGVGRVGPGRAGGAVMSDIRMKHDIVLLGRLDNGLGFYRFQYNGSDKAYVGVMAQEVQVVVPDAVIRGHDGYLRVFYDRLGLQFQTYDQWLATGARIPSAAPQPH
jgi:hypothetical protein